MRLEDRIDAMLDYALEMTFPASDPFTVYFPEVEPDDEAAGGPAGLPGPSTGRRQASE